MSVDALSTAPPARFPWSVAAFWLAALLALFNLNGLARMAWGVGQASIIVLLLCCAFLSDDSAGPKPTWAMLQAAVAPAELAQAQQGAVAELDALCRRKITMAYGESSLNDEMLLRLRGGETADQNTERDRLRTLFKTRRVAINAAPTAAVESLLASALADSFWAPPSD